MLPQDVVRAAADDYAGTLGRRLFDDIGLNDEQLVVDGHFVHARDAGAERVTAHDHGIQQAAGGLFVGVCKYLLRKAALFRRHGDERLVVERDVQLMGQLFPHLVTSASILACNGDDRQHIDSSLYINSSIFGK